ncbi:MAG: hypothetical protein ACK5FT_01205 [Sphingomonadales bacterium]
MKNENNHTDKQLQGLFQSFEPPLPKGVWDGIADKLDQNRRRRLVLWYSVAAVFIAVGIIAVCLGLSDSQKIKSVAKHNIEKTDSLKHNQKETSKSSAEHVDQQALNNNNGGKLHARHAEGNSADMPAEAISGEPTVKCVEPPPPPSAEATESSVLLPEPFGLRKLTAPVEVAKAPVWLSRPRPAAFNMPDGRWMISAGIMQQQSGNEYAVNPNFSRYVHKNYLNRMKEGEQAMGSIGLSVQLGYRLNKRYALMGGLNYRQMNTKQQFNFSDEVPVTLMPGNTPDKFGNYPIIGYFGSTGNVSYSGFQRNSLIEVPLGIMADFPVTRHWSVKPAVFINTGFVSGVSGFTLDYQQLLLTSQRLDWYRKVQMSAAFSMGAFRHISRNVEWGATLSGTRMITPAYVPDASVRPRNHALSVGTQIIWRID